MNKPPAKPFWDRNASPKSQRAIKQLARLTGADDKAMAVLFNSYFDLDVRDPVLPNDRTDTPDADLAYAIEAGIMRPSESLDHDQMIHKLLQVRDALNRDVVARAFVAGLSNQRLDLRSPLASYAYHLNHPKHVAEGNVHKAHAAFVGCAVCGLKWEPGGTRIDMDYNAMRLIALRTGGGVNHSGPRYALGDLAWFADAPPIELDDKEWAVLAKVLDAIRALPDDAELNELNKALTGTFKGDKIARRLVLETLGYCGILRSHSKQTILDRWFRTDDTEQPPAYYKREWAYPVKWWTGADGVDEQAVAHWFPRLAR